MYWVQYTPYQNELPSTILKLGILFLSINRIRGIFFCSEKSMSVRIKNATDKLSASIQSVVCATHSSGTYAL